jgi:glyoxylase-like metal-dependent hydrolase (beta-lactamase superfamily II)
VDRSRPIVDDEPRPFGRSAEIRTVAIKTLAGVGVGLALASSLGVLAAEQGSTSTPELHVLPVQGNVSMLVGPAGNITIQTGKDGVLLVDTMIESLATSIAAEVKKLSNLPIRYIIDTSTDPDHLGGNAALAAMGATGATQVPGGGATVIANEHVVNRMAPPAKPGETPQPVRSLPNLEYYTPTRDIYFNGEPVIIFHEPKAHTDGDSIVLFRRSDVVSTGDIFTPDRYPVIDRDKGGSVQGLLDALNHVLRLTVPERLQEGGTRVIPGHGRLCNEADVVEYRDMVTIVRDRIQDMVKRNLTLEQVKAARPTLDYDTRYGANEKFVEAVYDSLKNPSGK